MPFFFGFFKNATKRFFLLKVVVTHHYFSLQGLIKKDHWIQHRRMLIAFIGSLMRLSLDFLLVSC